MSEEAKVSYRRSDELARFCFGLVKRHGGILGTGKQKGWFAALCGKAEKALPGRDMAEKIRELLCPTDTLVAHQAWMHVSGEGGWGCAFIADDRGIRITLKERWSWRPMEGPGKPFSKDDYRDTALRRREQNAGLRELDKEIVSRIEIEFMREDG